MSKDNFYLAFKELVHHHKSFMVILTKTKVRKERLPSFLPSLGFPNHDIVEAKGQSGGILVLWTAELQVESIGLIS